MATAIANDIAQQTEEKATGMADFIGEKAEQATEAVGAGMETVGHAIRSHTPESGALADAAKNVAGKLERGGHYLEEKGLRGIGDDLTDVIRKNPIPTLIIGLGIGFALARILRS